MALLEHDETNERLTCESTEQLAFFDFLNILICPTRRYAELMPPTGLLLALIRHILCVTGGQGIRY